MFRRFLLAIVLVASLLLTLLPATGRAQTFHFDGYGGFSDPDPSVTMPTTPADGADDDDLVGFALPYDFANPTTFDTDINAFATFEWFAAAASHSHLSINELTPQLPPANSSYADPYTATIDADNLGGVVIGWLIHHNEVLVGGTPFGPDNVAVHYHLDIYADAAKTELVFSSGPMDFTLDMMETVNAGVAGVCLDNNGGTTGADTGFSPPCPDRFRVAQGWSNNPTGGGAFEQQVGTFDYRGTRYSVTISGFWDGDTLVGEAWSAENTHNQFDIRASIKSLGATAIPALPPVALALLSLLTALFGWWSLRRRVLP